MKYLCYVYVVAINNISLNHSKKYSMTKHIIWEKQVLRCSMFITHKTQHEPFCVTWFLLYDNEKANPFSLFFDFGRN